MTERGERLFQAMAGLSDEMILEAEQDGLQEPETGDVHDVAADAGSSEELREAGNGTAGGSAAGKLRKVRGGAAPDSRAVGKGRRGWLSRAGSTLKYLPVAACLCLVAAVAYFFVDNYGGLGRDSADNSFNLASEDLEEALDAAQNDASGADGGSGDGNADDSADTAQADAGAAVEEDAAADMAGSDGGADGTSDGAAPVTDSAGAPGRLPVRYDAYEGPLLTMTATGDTQSIETKRTVRAYVSSEIPDVGTADGGTLPVLDIEDIYRIKNTADTERTLQIVYPFVTTLNSSDGNVRLSVDGAAVETDYGIGDSVSAYCNGNGRLDSSFSDYRKILADAENDYQETALEKDTDWQEEVNVYTFTDISMDGAEWGGVIGLRIEDAGAKVLEYGFDHDAQTEDGARNYCFFADTEEKDIVLITADTEEVPELGYYTNLDCDQEADGIRCRMRRFRTTYGKALSICGGRMLKELQAKYDAGLYEEKLPEYLTEDTLFDALTVISGEDVFSDRMYERYRTRDIKEACETLLSETRIVYAMATVTIPANETVKIVAGTKKLQSKGHYLLPYSSDYDTGGNYYYDISADGDNPLNIAKTVFRLSLAGDWELSSDDMDLTYRKKKSEYRARLASGDYRLGVAAAAGPPQD